MNPRFSNLLGDPGYAAGEPCASIVLAFVYGIQNRQSIPTKSLIRDRFTNAERGAELAAYGSRINRREAVWCAPRTKGDVEIASSIACVPEMILVHQNVVLARTPDSIELDEDNPWILISSTTRCRSYLASNGVSNDGDFERLTDEDATALCVMMHANKFHWTPVMRAAVGNPTNFDSLGDAFWSLYAAIDAFASNTNQLFNFKSNDGTDLVVRVFDAEFKKAEIEETEPETKNPAEDVAASLMRIVGAFSRTASV